MHRLAQLQPVAAKCCGNSSHHSLWQPAKRQQQQNTVQQQQQHRSTSMTKYFDHLSFPSCPSTVVAAATHSRTSANTCMIPARYLASSTAHGQSLEQPQPPPTAACQFASCCTVSSHNVKSERHGSTHLTATHLATHCTASKEEQPPTARGQSLEWRAQPPPPSTRTPALANNTQPH